jgi:hypothetical protein
MGKLNDRLLKRYIKALAKEKARQQTLLNKLNLTQIEHFVVSRFPLITDHPHVINFNEIETRLKTMLNNDVI